MSYKIGLIGMVNEELKQDRWGTLKKLAEYGYQAVEGSFLVGADKLETKDNRRRLNDLGLELTALSCSHQSPEKLDATIENAQLLGAGLIVTYWGPADSEEQVLRDAAVMEQMAVKCEAAGLRYCYHNHDHEFVPKLGKKGNETAFDIIYDNTKHLCFQLDVGWCHIGKTDPVRLLRRIGHRVPILHIKDFCDHNARRCFTSVGTGVVNCFGAIEAAAAKGAKWMVVEEDRPNNLTHFESAIASIFNIREAGLLIR